MPCFPRSFFFILLVLQTHPVRITHLLLLLLFASTLKGQHTSTMLATPAYKDTVIKWMTIEEAALAQKKNPRKIVVSVYATWCRWCKLEDSVSFRHKEIAHYINQNFYPVKFNAESKAPIVFKGVRYNFVNEENRYVHEFAQYLLKGKLSYPGIAFINEDGYLIGAMNGYMDAYYMEAVLNYFSTGAYQTMKYRDFENDFEGNVEEPE